MYQKITYLAVTNVDSTNPPEGVDPQAWALAVINLSEIIRVDEHEGWPPSSDVVESRYLALIPNTTSGDYTGSLVDVANRQYFEDTHGEDDGYFYTRHFDGGNADALYVDLSHEYVVGEAYDYIWSDILGLLEYPVLSDDIYSQLTSEIVDAYVNDDFDAEVREYLSDEVVAAYGDDLTSVIFDLVYGGNDWPDREYPYVEGIDSVVLPYDAETAADLLAENLLAWQQAQTIHPDQTLLPA